jgi:radical SAM protein with 4Fe4S-binding SPASM domain
MFKKAKPLSPGIYHSRIDEGNSHYRLHLRVEKDGKGILIINAAKILHLNQTATEHAKLILEGVQTEEAVKKIRKRYRVPYKKALADHVKLRDMIAVLARTDDVCPITYLDVERIEPLSVIPSAPFRLDIALTYRCDNDCLHCYVGRPRDFPEQPVQFWKKALDKCWDLAIPHICFTGGEPTLYEGIVQLVEYAEDLGIVTGILTNGRRLRDKEFLDKLVTAGIDHFQITLESHREDVHDRITRCAGSWKETVEGIKNAVATPVYTITNTTLTGLNASEIEKTVDFIASLGVSVFAVNGIIYSGRSQESEIGIPEKELAPVLQSIIDSARRNNMRFIWYTPTRYCSLNPVHLGLGVKQCTAAKLNLCVEPDGTCIPCQSFYESLGNFVNDDFKQIWENPISVAIRSRQWCPDECRSCEDFALCGGGCPLYAKTNRFLCLDSKSST